MPYDGSGGFSVYTPGTPFTTGTTINSTTANAVNDDFATGLSNAICKDGQTTITANIPMSSHKFTGLAAGSGAGDSVRYEQVLLLAGGTMTGDLNVPDANMKIVGSVDATKIARFEVDGLTTATTRVLTVQDADNYVGAAQQTLTDGATINWDMATGIVASVTLGGNRTMAAPTNLKVGTYILHVIQDGTGSRTITWNAVFKWQSATAPTLTTTAAARDIFCFISDGTNLYGNAMLNVS